MLNAITFNAPWLLGFLAVLPVLWWLLRLTPPAPRKVVFPALALLRGLAVPEQTPARTPWWLLVLRLVIAALIITGFARPLINPLPIVGGKGALLIVVDNDWAAARDWDQRQKILHDLVHQAIREHHTIMVLPTAPTANGDPITILGPMAAEAADAAIQRLAPMPWTSDWQKARELADSLDRSAVVDAIWLASGLGGTDAAALFDTLQHNGGARLICTDTPIYTLAHTQDDNDALSIKVSRAATDNQAALTVDALARDSNILARLPVHFTAGAPQTKAPLDLPVELRNQIARFEIEGSRTAASVELLDSTWDHRAVGIAGDKAELDRHSLLSGLFYIDRALKPYADLHIDTVDALLKSDIAALIVTDTTPLNDQDIQPLHDWISHGGIFVRFAGAHLATVINPREGELLPVTLRTGDRAMGGALSWTTPQKLRVFPADSPFQGLTIPPDVTVSRQVLAEPSADLTGKTWATLEDGTPLVTAKKIGQGLSILFHIPARSDWSNLPISGLFVDMLRRVVDLSRGTPPDGNAFTSLPPLRTLDGFGEEQKPHDVVQTINSDDVLHLVAGPQHPPGLYGSDSYNRAFNLGDSIGQPESLTGVPIETQSTSSAELDLQPYLLLAAFLLLLGDFVISLWLRGYRIERLRKIAAIFGIFIIASLAASAQAATDEKTAVELTSKTYLAYVRTGDRATDHIAEAGLTGLANAVQHRTSIDHVGVVNVDPENDDLAFFPFLYWPVVAGEAPLSPQGAARVNDYLHHGGMILFDAMDSDEASPVLMQRLLMGVDVPPLVRIPENHVLRRSFYLLDEFPGRTDNHDLWLEPEDMSSYDGVATVLYGSNGWAAAWAMDASGKPMFPCTPGGEMQREYAFRFGINLVMYALTGNYKSDQLHTQALLEKLGR